MKYYGTLGPACETADILEKMIQTGMTGIRLNLSHKSLRESKVWIHEYFKAAEKVKIRPDFMIDLMGPELRIGELPGEMMLGDRTKIALGGDQVPVPDEVRPFLKEGQIVLLDDGKMKLEVIESGKNKTAVCRVLRGGRLKSRKSIMLPGCTVHRPVLTPMDEENLSLAARYGVTEVMLPFVRGKEDLLELRRTLDEKGCSGIRIYAKIENMEGVGHLEEIIPASDTIVIARGDLGNAVPLTELPCLQDWIAHICRKHDKEFMVVTQMLDSMTRHPYPTRAEVSDIFQAVMQGASALMLTEETAMGRYPVKAMEILTETGSRAEKYLQMKMKQVQ